MNRIIYSFYCNFCGKQFEVGRWDGKTCSKICRTRLARMTKFTDGDNILNCIICGKKYLSEKLDKTCGNVCKSIINDIKIYGLTDKINDRIRDAKSAKGKKK